jgi:hypothetical protein
VSVLLREVLDIPKQWGAEDYVLRLTDSVDPGALARTLDDYVVTSALTEAFDAALGLVAEAVKSGVSRGAFLKGSFGSGKSHFMAVLYALLQHDPAARAKKKLQPVVARHDDVLLDRKVLPLAYHLLGAESLEQALFDGYLRQVRGRFPDAPLPALHQSDGILADAENLRASYGDDRFFAELNGGPGAGAADPWAGLLGSGTWTSGSYAAARAAAPGSEQRQLLVTALAQRFFTAYTQQAGYVDLDAGLAAIAQHAKGLGYDAVTLFLDELVLWLAFSVRDIGFFRRESQKLTKLVEAGAGGRAIPLVSFVARQLDLRRWFADSGASGAEQEALDRAFRHQEGRFTTITLGDDNLPQVARQRLLRRNPANPQADAQLAEAFGRLDRRQEIWDVLLDGVNTDKQHRGSDEAAFKLTYPFSPALVSMLRELAAVMQRERTALKVMQQMLVERRDTLTVDDVIPVGEAFDYLIEGQAPLDAEVAALFKAATALYRDKLLPRLLVAHGVTGPDAADPARWPDGLRADDRLAKTLLLSAIAPKVPALKELTASRLASLNHGSIRSPLPGHEATVVLGKVREWQRQVPEIHVGSETGNPVIRVQLSDVDYQSVVERARGEDNDGRRRELIRDLVRDALGIADSAADMYGAIAHPVIWRGSRREVDIVFGNVRDASWLTDDHFRARPGTWRVVIDHPFDQPGHSGAEDYARLDKMIEVGLRSSTIVWLPRFLSEERMTDVRRLVVLDYLLGGSADRWARYADRLSAVDRVQARAILESQRTALREGLRRSIQECYGAAAPTPGTLAPGGTDDRVLISLDPGFSPAAPVGADLGAAFVNLVDQAFSATYPGHPRFEPGDVEVTTRNLAAVYDHVDRAVADPDGRVKLEGDIAAVRRVANQLGVGAAGETHFLFGDDRFGPWGAEFERAAARDGIQPQDPVRADRVREWIDAMTPRSGLRPEIADLIVLAWAALRQRAWYEHGTAIPAPKPGAVRPGMELRPERLPAPQDWQAAVSRAEQIFGLHVNPYLTAAGVGELAGKLNEAAARHVDVISALASQVELAYQHLGMPDDGKPGRLETARACAKLTEAMTRALDRVGLITALAHAQHLATEAALAKSITQAPTVTQALQDFRWDRLMPLISAAHRPDERGQAAARILGEFKEAMAADEFSVRLAQALATAEQAAFEWLAEGQSRQPGQPEHRDPTGIGQTPARPAGSAMIDRGGEPDQALAALRIFLDEHRDAQVTIEWRVSG